MTITVLIHINHKSPLPSDRHALREALYRATAVLEAVFGNARRRRGGS
jgi:hypothetical protein